MGKRLSVEQEAAALPVGTTIMAHWRNGYGTVLRVEVCVVDEDDVAFRTTDDNSEIANGWEMIAYEDVRHPTKPRRRKVVVKLKQKGPMRPNLFIDEGSK